MNYFVYCELVSKATNTILMASSSIYKINNDTKLSNFVDYLKEQKLKEFNETAKRRELDALLYKILEGSMTKTIGEVELIIKAFNKVDLIGEDWL